MVVVDASVLVDALLIDGAARARLAERLPEQHALQALATSQRLGLRRHASRHLWPRAWELRTTLLTADARAARAPGLRCRVELVRRRSSVTS